MKAHLMSEGADFDVEAPLPDHADALIQDLELTTVFAVMADGDELLAEVARRAILQGTDNVETVRYRQQMLSDCLANPETIEEIYALSGDALAAEKTVYRTFGRDSPSSVATRSVKVLALLLGFLKRLRALTDARADDFSAPGFERFFAMIADELDDAYLQRIDAELDELRFSDGILISARLGQGNHGIDYVPRRAPHMGWWQRFSLLDRAGYSFTIPDRDESGFRALRELEDRTLNTIGNALAQSTDHVLSFFTLLRIEISFYVGCLHLHEQLCARELPTCLPAVVGSDERALSGQGLYDASLALRAKAPVVGNPIAGDGISLVMITGANQGGKSTFLRALGAAQLMSQAGMFVAARAYKVNLTTGLFTHFKREEDETMASGKLDEELRRIGEIADRIAPGGLLLCNESFASTNEREGSEIGRQIVRAMLDEQIKVIFVTHQFDLASGFHRAGRSDALFLRAARERDGERSYEIAEGGPLPTSYGEDSYRTVFGTEPSVQ